MLRFSTANSIGERKERKKVNCIFLPKKALLQFPVPIRPARIGFFCTLVLLGETSSREAEMPMNGAAIGTGASTHTCGSALSLLDALVRRLLSAAVGFSRRQPPSTYLVYNPRLRRRGISERVFSAARLCVCVVAHTPAEAAVFNSPKHL